MGASILLFDKFERQIGKTSTKADGRFAFADLMPDAYAIRISVPSFLPAFRDRIEVKAGLDSMLRVHLATMLSDIQISYALPSAVMTDDWKWVLRSAPATRPITRYLPLEEASSSSATKKPGVFSSTHATVSLTGGDSAILDDAESDQTDVGTSFALSTNVFGKNQVQFSGTVGQVAGIAAPLMGFSVVYSREEAHGFSSAPEVTLSVRELAIAGSQAGPGDNVAGALPIVRDASMSVYQTSDIADNIHLEYGATAETISSLRHTSRISPFARVTVNVIGGGEVAAAYSNGGRPNPLYSHQEGRDESLDGSGNTVSSLPQVSYRDSRLQVQRTQNYELGYRKTSGSRTYAVSAFYEDVSNGRISVAGDTSMLDSGDLIWDGNSKTAAYNIGRFNRSGYVASVEQRLNSSFGAGLAYGRLGGFTPRSGGLDENSDDQFLARDTHNFAAVTVHAKAPGAGTQIYSSYGWVDDGAIVPRHVFATQNMAAEPGLNCTLKQPLPSFFGLAGHLEIVADARNLLAQGYLPITSSHGRELLAVQAPRAIRGGLNFIF